MYTNLLNLSVRRDLVKFCAGLMNAAKSVLLFHALLLKSVEISLVKQSMNCSVTLACDVVALTRKDEYILSGPISFSILANKETITLLNIKTGCVWQSS